jgi:hypothetical protein
MKNTSKIHSASVEAFIEYLKKVLKIEYSALIRRMYYNIGWPVETIVYVLTRLNALGYNYPTDIDKIHRVIRSKR